MKTLILFLSLINSQLDMKMSDETYYLTVNYSKLLSEPSFSLSEGFCYAAPRLLPNMAATLENLCFIKNEIPLPQKDRYLKGAYLMFLLGVACTAIGLEVLLNKKTNAVKQHHLSLAVHHQVMQKRNNRLHVKLNKLKRHTEKNNRVFQVMAHDLRSPVAAIVGLSGLMIDEQKLPPADMKVINLIHTSGQDSLSFINEILSQDLTLQPERGDINVKQFLTYCVAQLQVTADEKQQQIILKGNDYALNVNRSQIWRVFTNLLSNAIKFSPDFSIITVNVEKEDQFVQVKVVDQGIGIPDHLKSMIFTQNENRKRRGTTGEQSFGMGLAIAKRYVEAHGGRLHFESEVDQGTTFFVYLPMA